MPVTLNEPLSTLQRLCEELEYSDLIDKAVLAPTPLERLMYCSWFLWTKRKWTKQVGGSLLDLRLWVEQRASKPQTVQPSPWRDLRVHQGGQGLPLRRRTGEPSIVLVKTWWLWPTAQGEPPSSHLWGPSGRLRMDLESGWGFFSMFPVFLFFFVGNVNTWNPETWRTCG